MRDEEGRKQGHTNHKAKQHSTRTVYSKRNEQKHTQKSNIYAVPPLTVHWLHEAILLVVDATDHTEDGFLLACVVPVGRHWGERGGERQGREGREMKGG